MLKIRRPLGRLIFNMGIAIPGKTVFLIETAPCFWHQSPQFMTFQVTPQSFIAKGNLTSRELLAKFCALEWRHNERYSVSNHRHLNGLLNRLFRRRSKETSKLRVTGLCEGIHRWPVNSHHKGPVPWKMFPFDDVIMGSKLSPATASWKARQCLLTKIFADHCEAMCSTTFFRL